MVLKKTRKNKTAVKYKIKGSGNISSIKSTAKKSKKIRKIGSQRRAQRSGVKLKKIEDLRKGNLISSKRLKKDKRNYLKTNLKVHKNPLQGSTKEKCPSRLKNPFTGVKLQKELESIHFVYNKSEEKNFNNQIFVSLDALEDYENPRSRIRKLSGRKGRTTSLNINKKIPFTHKQFSSKNQESQITASEKADNRKNEREIHKKSSESPKDLKELFFQGRKFCEFERIIKSTEKQSSSKIVSKIENSTQIADSVKTEFSKVDLNLWPFFPKEESSKNEISKVDEDYIKSLLLLATNKDTQNSTNPIGRTPSNKESRSQKKNTKTKMSNHQLPDENVKNEKSLKKNDIKRESVLAQPKLPKVKTFQQNVYVSTPLKKKTPILRVLTKSDNRLKKELEQISRVESDIKIKKSMTCSQTKNTETKNRKRRTLLTNTFRNKQKESNELSFSDKTAGASDVKEIWRRDNRNESENSLSSRSSTTVLEKHELLDGQILGMQSYIALKKIVDLEIERITKSNKKDIGDVQPISINSNKNPTEIIKNINKNIEPATFNEVETKSSKNLLKNICNEDTVPATKNLNYLFDISEEKIDFVVKRRIFQVEMQKNMNRDCLAKENEEIQDTEKFLHRDTSQEIKAKLKKLSEEKAPETKIPEEIVKNWSILHRLEKAFLALGTPNFQSKTESSATIKTRKGTAKETDNFLRERAEGGKMKTESSHTNGQLRNLKVPGDSMKIKTCSKNSNALNATLETSKKNKKMSKSTLKEEKKAEVLFMNRKSNFSENATQASVFKSNQNRKTENHEKRTLGRHFLWNKTKLLEENQKKGILNAPANTNSSLKSFVKTKSSIKDGDDTKNTQAEVKQGKYSVRNNLKLAKKIRDVPAGKFGKRKSSRVLVCNTNNQSKNGEETLERKRTFDVIPRKDKIDPQKSKSCYKLDKKSQLEIINCFPITLNQGCKTIQNAKTEFWDFLEEHAKNDANNLGQKLTAKNEGSENQPNSPKNENVKALFKKPTKEQMSPLKKTGILGVKSRNLATKESTKGNAQESSKTFLKRFPQIKKQQKENVIDELPPQILPPRKDTNKSSPGERAIKERSILSIRRNQVSSQAPLKNLNEIQKNCSPKCQTQLTIPKAEEEEEMATKEDTNIVCPKNLQIEKLNCTGSASSCTSTGTYDLPLSTLPNISPSKPLETINFQKNFHDTNADFSSLSTLSTTSFDVIPSKSDSRKVNSKLNKPLWEKDIKHYRTIVKDIMNQYERTSGLLKQGTPIRHLKCEAEEPENRDGDNEGHESKLFATNDEKINIREYRKKIMSEYEAIPIFEYKSQIERNKEQIKNEDATGNRILKTVQNLNAELDVDIKDFQPNVHKVLDSQIYVDKESLCKRNNGLCKPKEKSCSLEEASLNKIEQNEPKWQRTLSMPRTFASVKKSSNLMKIFWETPKVLYIKEDTVNLSANSSSLTTVTQTESEVVDYS